MKKGFFASLLIVLTGAGAALAETMDSVPSPAAEMVTGEGDSTPAGLWNDCCTLPKCECGPRLWVSAEYLLWWIKNSSVGPLVTTGDPNAPNGGLLGDPSTRVLFGDRGIDYGAFSGGRLGIGFWINTERTLGLEASGFLLERRAVNFGASSNPAGSPLLVLPFQDLNGRPDGFFLSSPGVFSGNVIVSSSSRLWGADVNGAYNLWRGRSLSADVLAGFRFLELDEDLQDNVFSVGGSPIFTEVGTDHFNTRNQFYGGQLGGRLGYRTGRLSANLTALVALGTTHQVSDTAGSSTIVGGPGIVAGTFPGFVYSQPSNIGHLHHNDFSVVPQAQIKLGYDLFRNIRVTAGYDFLYWTNVLRPGQQIDPVVNTSQTAPNSLGGNLQLVGPARPMPVLNASDFWAQGVSFGLEFRW